MDAIFFERRTSWKGFLISEGTREEKANLLQLDISTISNPEIANFILDIYQLHMIQTQIPDLTVKIIARNIYPSKDNFM